MQYHHKWLKYWKNSLADAQRLPANVEQANPLVIPFEGFLYLMAGIIPAPIVEPFFASEEQKMNKERGITKLSDRRWKSIDRLDIYIALFTLNPKPEYLQFAKGKKPIYPFCVPAVLSRDGKLEVHENFFPFVPREFLDPVTDGLHDFIFSSVDQIDKAAACRLAQFVDWQTYCEYVISVFFLITGMTLSSYQEEDFFIKTELTIVVQEEKGGSSAAIIALYEHLLNSPNIPPLLKCLISLDAPKLNLPMEVGRYLDFHTQHMGQMGSTFSLSISQRKSLYSFLDSPDNTVLAVNGPPGTGKTTLLQSVVANAVVRAAIEGKEAPIILACSANNQAVTNINESFSKTSSNLKALEGHWLPNFNGYATYLPASGKSEEELKSINYRKLDGGGTFEVLEKPKYLSEAKDYFLNKANLYLRKNYLSVDEATNGLQKQIKAIEKELEQGTRIWKQLIDKKVHLLQLLDKNNSEVFEEIDLDNALFWSNFKLHLEGIEQKIVYYFRTEPFLRKLFCLLRISSSIKERERSIRLFFIESLVNTQKVDFYSKGKLLAFLANAINGVNGLNKIFIQWQKWKNTNEIKTDPVDTEEAMWDIEYLKLQEADPKASYFYDEIDVKHRHKAFQLAVHYWEGRWLQAMQAHQNKEFRKSIQADQKTKWRIRAMLTPCFVSTFYMAPKYFAYSIKEGSNTDSVWQNAPLLNFVDLLIVDESGQVTPELGVAVFALAKKAMVVGDVKQIEPVWSIVPKIDHGNLNKTGILEIGDDDTLKTLNEKGFLASSGSIMKMAQNASRLIDPQNKMKERGMILTEHRRCNNEIIEYCNNLAYKGMLKPMKGKAKEGQPFPPMLLMHVEGNSSVVNKERTNIHEAQFIATWLAENKQKIESHYLSDIENLVGVITPFKAQKRLLIWQLKQVGFDVVRMKIGTVHALQGAEKEIVLFSTVYGDGDVSTMFFDKGNKPNILNVAVSRAKESFIVFGNERIFNEEAKTPSGLLRSYLQISSEECVL